MHSYKPARLTQWVKREIPSEMNNSREEKRTETRKLRIEILRETMAQIMRKSIAEFDRWMQSLTTRELNSLVFLFEELQTKEQKDLAVKALFGLASTNRQLFKNCLDCFYRKGETYPYWTLAKVAYSKNRERLSRRWDEDELIDWDRFMQQKSNPEVYIVDTIHKTKKSLEEVCSEFRLYNSHYFYRSILIRMFETADYEFFEREKELFIEQFLLSDIEGKQKLINAFVHSGSLPLLEDIGQLIYEKMSTYMRKQQLWHNVKDAYKESFHRWAMLQNIREFFSGLDKDHERFLYWEKFIPKMVNAEVLKKERTVLFYFEDVVIMEILGTGAVYIYEKRYFINRWQEKVEEFLQAEERMAILGHSYNPVRLTRRFLMDPDNVIRHGRLTHGGQWQEEFDSYLSKYLNWEVNRDAILQQGKKQVTI